MDAPKVVLFFIAYMLVFSIFLICFTNGQLVPRDDIVRVQEWADHDEGVHPSIMSFWFEYGGGRVYYNLTKNERVTSALSPALMKKSAYLPEGVMMDGNEHEFAFYTNGEDSDSPTRSNFLVHRPQPGRPARLYGSMSLNGRRVYIGAETNTDVLLHRIRRDTSQVHGHSRVEFDVTPGTDNIIELLFWGAGDFYTGFQSSFGHTTAQMPSALSGFFNGLAKDLDLVWQDIRPATVRIYLLDHGYDSSTSTSWLANNYNATTGHLDGTAALVDLSTYLQGLVGSSSIKSFDHAVALTQYNLATSNEVNPEVIAVSQTDSMCGSPSSVSIAEVSQPFVLKAVAWAIAFAMGIVTQSTPTRYSIMSSHLKIDVPANRFDRPWHFHQASRNLASNYITALDVFSINCLLTQDASFDFTKFFKKSSLGQVLTLDEQCKLVHGSSSTVCAGNTPSTVCYTGVLCTTGTGCDGTIYAADKTPCDTDLACSGGSCSYVEVTSTSSSTSSSASSSTSSSTTSPTTVGEGGESSTQRGFFSTDEAYSSSTNFNIDNRMASISNDQRLQEDHISAYWQEPPVKVVSVASSTEPPQDCNCCESRKLGTVVVDIKYLPQCGDDDNDRHDETGYNFFG